jgi:hypothetical protein
MLVRVLVQVLVQMLLLMPTQMPRTTLPQASLQRLLSRAFQ